MNAHCCHDEDTDHSERLRCATPRIGRNSQLLTFGQRCRERAGWIVPATVLALLPKCPACIAAYIALGSGIGISMTAAADLRMLAMGLCLASLSYFGAKRLQRFIYSRSGTSAEGESINFENGGGN